MNEALAIVNQQDLAGSFSARCLWRCYVVSKSGGSNCAVIDIVYVFWSVTLSSAVSALFVAMSNLLV